MKKSIKILVAFACVVCAGSLWAATRNAWMGTVNNQWSEDGNWSLLHKPTVDEAAVFGSHATAPSYVIQLSGTESCAQIVLDARSDWQTEQDPHPVTLTGGGKIVAASSPWHGDGRILILDGVTYEQTAGAYVLNSGASITVDNDGGFVMKDAGPFFRFYDNSSFTLNSGKASFYPFGDYATDMCTFRVNGGAYDFSSYSGNWVNTFPANAVIDFRGGKILKTTAEAIKDHRYLPKGTAVFDNQGGSGSGAMAFAGDFDEEFSGTLYLTNKANAAVNLSGAAATLWGRGTYFAQWFYPNGENAVHDFDLARFVLKQYLYGNSSTLRFRRGVEFGAWGGDVSTYNGPNEIDFYGDAVFNTADAIDGTTARTIKISNGTVKLMPCASISVTGAGTAKLNTATMSAADPLEKIDVGAGSTLEFGGTVNASKAPIKAADLTMGANAKIAYTVKYASIESVKKPTVGAGAGFQVSTSGMTAGTPLAVYYGAAADGDDPMPAVAFSGSAGNWQVKRLGGLLYLEDNATYPELTDATGWKTAPADGYWETAGNWVGGAAPTANDYAVFYASAVAVITNQNAVTCKGLVGGVSLTSGNTQKPTTPYVFRGQPLTLSSNTSYFLSGAICWWGQTPIIFENAVAGSGANNFFVYINKPTFAEFRNTLTATGALNVNGDVRIAGAATAKSLTFGTTAGGRPSVLHVYNGGSLALSAQDGVMTDVNSILAISAGSTVDVAGTKLAFNSAATRSHIVDGTLTATCPYVNMGTQTFAGTGTAAFASATTAEGGAGVTYLAHGMTLKMGGDWQTAADATATSKIALDKFETATLGATANWTYGPKAGVTPTSEAESRALTLGDHSTLTVAAGNYTITLAEPIVGAKASVNLASGTLRLSDADQVLDSITFVGGKLSATRDAVSGGWTTLVTAKKITGEPLLGSGLKGKVVANGDGTFSIKAKFSKGMVVIVY